MDGRPSDRKPTIIRVARRASAPAPETLLVVAKPSLKRRMVSDFAGLGTAGEDDDEDEEGDAPPAGGAVERRRRVDPTVEEASPAAVPAPPPPPTYVFKLVESVDRASAASKSFSKQV